MKRLLFAIAALSLASFCLSDGQARFLIRDGRKHGYIDVSGKVVIPAQFDKAEEFSEGLAAVAIGEKRGYIDPAGKWAIELPPWRALGIGADPFSGGYAAAMIDLRWTLIDRTGEAVLPPEYAPIGGFHEGLLCVTRLPADYKPKPLYQTVEPIGSTAEYERAERARRYGRSRYVYVDSGLKPVFEIDAASQSSFSEGLAPIVLDGKTGYIDKRDRWVIPPKFREGRLFSESLAAVKSNGKFGFIDKTGRVVIPCRYDDALSFQEGLAAVRVHWKWGFIDKRGRFTIKPMFREAAWEGGGFCEGLAAVTYQPGKSGYINKAGKWVVKPQFYATYGFHNGLAFVTDSHGDGYLNHAGKFAWRSKKR